jgi:hypothetical protein
MEVRAMKRLFPFVLTTFVVVLSLGLLTAYRTGLFAKVSEIARQRSEAVVVDIPTIV